jgi:integrase
LLGLRWTDADLEAGTLTVRRSLDVDGTFKSPKNRAARRTLRLTPRPLDTLKAHKVAKTPNAFRPGRTGKITASCFPTPWVNR